MNITKMEYSGHSDIARVYTRGRKKHPALTITDTALDNVSNVRMSDLIASFLYLTYTRPLSECPLYSSRVIQVAA